MLLTGLAAGLEKVHIAMLCLPRHFRHEYFSEHVFAKCPSFKQTKRSPFCLINFFRAEVSEIKRHLFDDCLEPQNTYDVVCHLLQRISDLNTVSTKKISHMKILFLAYQQMM